MDVPVTGARGFIGKIPTTALKAICDGNDCTHPDQLYKRIRAVHIPPSHTRSITNLSHGTFFEEV